MTEDIRHAAGFVLFRDAEGQRQYLLLKNARHGTWGFPKGHRDGHEDDLSCARRELEEETALSDIEILSGFDRTESYPLPGKSATKSVRYFLARLKSGEVRLSEEHECGGFQGLDEALQNLQHESARALLRAAETRAAEETRS